MSPDLHRALKRRSTERGITLNQACVDILERAVRAPVSAELPDTLQPAGPLVERLHQQWGAALLGLVLFGSAARGEMTAASDVDLLVVLAPDTDISRDLYRRWNEAIVPDLPPGLRGRLAPHFVTLPPGPTEAGSLWYEVAVDGRILLDREGRVEHFLRALRRELARGTVSRRFAHGHPYWIWRAPRDGGAE
jgi:predicted nucleotidyltransferase